MCHMSESEINMSSTRSQLLMRKRAWQRAVVLLDFQDGMVTLGLVRQCTKAAVSDEG